MKSYFEDVGAMTNLSGRVRWLLPSLVLPSVCNQPCCRPCAAAHSSDSPSFPFPKGVWQYHPSTTANRLEG